MKLLLTAGGTREPIDSVRSITNFSTGTTGARLAEAFAARGHTVKALVAESATVPAAPCLVEKFGTFAELDLGLRRRLEAEPFDAVIHLAAVSDFSIESIETGGKALAPGQGKLDSNVKVTLHLRPNFKLLERIKAYATASPALQVVGFKLTHTASGAERLQAVETLVARGGVDFIVHNDLGDMRTLPYRRFTLYRGSEALGEYRSEPELAGALERVLLKEEER